MFLEWRKVAHQYPEVALSEGRRTRALRFAQGTSRQAISTDELRLFAIIKSIEVIGEASTKVSEETRAQLTSIEWRGSRIMRNQLIHGFDTVNFDILWDTIELALPLLIVQLKAALGRN